MTSAERTARLRAEVAAYLAEHPGASVGDVARALDKPEYLPHYGAYLSQIVSMVDALRVPA